MRLVLLLAITLLLAACAKGSDKTCEGLFCKWTTPDGQALDLNNGHYGTNPVDLSVGGAQCTCQALVDNVDWFELHSCEYSGTEDGDPLNEHGCPSLDKTYTYTMTGQALTLCDLASPTTCRSYY